MATANNMFLPTGWVRDVPNQQYRGPNGEIITETDIVQHGSFENALISRYGIGQMKIHRYRPSNPKVGDVVVSGNMTEVYTNHGWVANHHITSSGAASIVNNGGVIVSSPIQPANTLSFETDQGRVSVNIKTGELTIPVGMSRLDTIREFWLGFQEHFNPHPEASKYKKEIADLKHDLESCKALVITADVEALRNATKKVVEKIATKYRGEKFIMVKPDDLIKFIESEE